MSSVQTEMKALRRTEHDGQHPRSRAFTVVELLVVVAVIAILAALLLPTVPPGRGKSKVRAKVEISQLAAAIRDYESAYGGFPVSTTVTALATNVPSSPGSSEDCTYGLAFLASQGMTPAPLVNTPNLSNNAEVIAILMDLETYGNGAQTVNFGHARNPQRIKFLSANLVSDTKSPGVGLDGCFRDPWGTPYLITMDLNGDGKTRDAFYRSPLVSADPADRTTPKRGLNGLIPTVLNTNTCYEANTPVMVWSAGPDKAIQPGGRANVGANKDNVLSWK